MIEFKEVKEQSRTYYFADGKFTVDGVVRIAIPGQTHRLETADGKKFIVRSGWHAIEIDTPEWSF